MLQEFVARGNGGHVIQMNLEAGNWAMVPDVLVPAANHAAALQGPDVLGRVAQQTCELVYGNSSIMEATQVRATQAAAQGTALDGLTVWQKQVTHATDRIHHVLGVAPIELRSMTVLQACAADSQARLNLHLITGSAPTMQLMHDTEPLINTVMHATVQRGSQIAQRRAQADLVKMLDSAENMANLERRHGVLIEVIQPLLRPAAPQIDQSR